MEQMKQIVSMIASDTKITLITLQGDILDLKHDGPYDTSAISEFLLPELTGGNVVEIDLQKYLSFANALTPEYEEDGIVISHTIDGQTIQGIFYPQKAQVVVRDEWGDEIAIPKVEKLSAQMKRAQVDQSPAVRNFLKRLAPVVKDRKHSAEDLMDFIEKSELPLTNDGMIVGYKRVNRSKDEGYYVDCHSGRVKQRLGSIVCMDIDGVDPDRNRSCSHGLHVANLGYLRNFSGHATLMVLVDPAHFIAVPHGETTKARVMQYLVVGVLSDNAHAVSNYGPVTDDEIFTTLVSNVISGIHCAPVERVKVDGSNIEVTPFETVNVIGPKPLTTEAVRSGKSLLEDEPDPKTIKKDIRMMAKTAKAETKNAWDSAPTEVITVFKAMMAGKDSKAAIAVANNTSTRTMGRWAEKYDYDGWVASQATAMTVSERARMLFEQAAFDALVALKKAKKKGWAALGFTSKEVKKIESYAS